MDYEDDVSRELIKCVVVGDTGVGKTRLICAKACGQKPTLEQLINVHVPTVWAIDQYRICRDVLERSLEVVDGISIALRIWDTFGDHHNDRCFAYGRSDVVLLCFSVASSRSLEHAKVVWYPEIRRQRPNVPVLLVGCKNDLRYLCSQAEFQRLLTERRPSPLKPVVSGDIVSPEQGRAVAKEIGAFYYETSVLTRFGVEETFQNAVRAALCRRRQGRLWSGHFQYVKYPQVQEPCLPPKPAVPTVRVIPSSYVEQMANLIVTSGGASSTMGETYYDCVLRVKDQEFKVHKLVLASSSRMFSRLFVCDIANCRSCALDEFDFDNCSGTEVSLDSLQCEKSDRDHLLDDDTDVEVFCLPVLHRQLGASSMNFGHTGGKETNGKNHKRRKSADLSNRNVGNVSTTSARRNRHATIGGMLTSNWTSSRDFQASRRSVHVKSACTSVADGLPNCIQSINDDFRCRNNCVIIPLSVVTLNNELSPTAVRLVLNYVYCGELEPHSTCRQSSTRDSKKASNMATLLSNVNYVDLIKVSEEFQIDSLRDAVLEMMAENPNSNGPVNADAQFLTDRSSNLIRMGLDMGLFSDVKFVLDNGTVRAQKFLLCARCDVMRAMFTSAFRESCMSQVTLPGVSVEALNLFLTYLFVDSINCYQARSCVLLDFMEALELANRMCTQRLVTVIESEMVNELERLDAAQELNTEEVLHILEPAQMCNAQQLVAWCFNYLCCNYSRVCDQCGKILKSLSPSNQDYIAKHRWPPIWYLKEYDWHEKVVREGQRAAEMAANKLLKRTRTASGCLCFSTRASSRMQHNSI